MKKLNKIKSVIAGIFNNIPAYTKITMQAMGLCGDSLKAVGLRMGATEKEEYNNFMTRYIESLEGSFKTHRKEFERVLTREMKKLTLEQIEFIEKALEPEMLQSMTALNMSIVPITMKISMEALNDSGVMDFDFSGGTGSKPIKKRTVMTGRSSKVRKGTKIKTAKK